MKGDSSLKVAAILVSAGSGQRFGSETSTAKQYQPLAGKPIYTWGLNTLLMHPLVSKVVLVVAPGLEKEIEADCQKWCSDNLEKLSVTTGGASRQASVFNGLKSLEDANPDCTPDLVIVHDSARPFISNKMIDGVIKCLEIDDACTIGTPVSDTVKRVDNDLIGDTIDRANLVSVQTPQGAWFAVLLKAHKRAEADGWVTTDDAAIMERAGYKVRVVNGTSWNIKITTQEDLRICETLASAFNR